jgi:hypothetical protein
MGKAMGETANALNIVNGKHSINIHYKCRHIPSGSHRHFFWLGLVICIIRTHPKPPSVFPIPTITSLGHTNITAPTTSTFSSFWKIHGPMVGGVLPLPRYVLVSDGAIPATIFRIKLV